MKRMLFTAVALLVGASAFSQQALGPASGITSPEINPDTFGYVGQFSGVAVPSGDNDPELAAQKLFK